MRHIGERIDAIIKKAGISRARLGEILGVKEGAIGRHIRGETDPGALALFKIAQIGGVTIDWLITGKNNGNQNEGKTIEEALKISKNDISEELGGLPPVKVHCSILATEAFEEAVKNYREKQGA